MLAFFVRVSLGNCGGSRVLFDFEWNNECYFELLSQVKGIVIENLHIYPRRRPMGLFGPAQVDRIMTPWSKAGGIVRFKREAKDWRENSLFVWFMRDTMKFPMAFSKMQILTPLVTDTNDLDMVRLIRREHERLWPIQKTFLSRTFWIWNKCTNKQNVKQVFYHWRISVLLFLGIHNFSYAILSLQFHSKQNKAARKYITSRCILFLEIQIKVENFFSRKRRQSVWLIVTLLYTIGRQ